MRMNLQQIVADPKLVGDGSLGDSAAKLKKIGHDLATSVQYMTAEQLALTRMILGIDSEFSTRGLFVPSDHIYGVGRDTDFLIVDPMNSIFRNPQAATYAHSMGREIDASKEYDRLRQMARPHASEALKTGVLLVTRDSYMEKLPTDKFGQLDVPVFVFGWENTAADYGDWLGRECGIKEIIHTVESAGYTSQQHKQFVRASWFNSLGLSSGLDGSRKNLHLDGSRVGGVIYAPAEHGCFRVPKKAAVKAR